MKLTHISLSLLSFVVLAACAPTGSGGSSSSSSVSSVASSMAAQASSHSMINASYPQPNDTVVSPLVIRGQARGNWYFEASFPIKLLDGNGNQIAISHAEAQSDWMTTNFVPYVGTLTFTTPLTTTGTLVLMKDNPSGLPENDDSISIPVQF